MAILLKMGSENVVSEFDDTITMTKTQKQGPRMWAGALLILLGELSLALCAAILHTGVLLDSSTAPFIVQILCAIAMIVTGIGGLFMMLWAFVGDTCAAKGDETR